MIDILKCPFCGAEDEADFTRSCFGKVYVKCLVCGAQGPQYDKTEDAISAWNDVSILSTLKKDVSKNSEKIDTMRFELIKTVLPIVHCEPFDDERNAARAIQLADNILAKIGEK